MALNNEDFVEILGYTRHLLIERGFRDIDERLVSGLHAAEGNSFYDLVGYLKGLTELTRSATSRQMNRTLARLREFVRTEDGGPIAGFDLVMTEGDADRFRTDETPLGGSAELDNVVEELEGIIGQLFEEYHNGE
jgi:hypothetical protein